MINVLNNLYRSTNLYIMDTTDQFQTDVKKDIEAFILQMHQSAD